MTNLKEAKEKWEQYPLWRLNYKLAEVEGRIFSLIRDGESNKSRLLKRKRGERSVLREIMFDKLLLWKKGILIDDDLKGLNKKSKKVYKRVKTKKVKKRGK